MWAKCHHLAERFRLGAVYVLAGLWLSGTLLVGCNAEPTAGPERTMLRSAMGPLSEGSPSGAAGNGGVGSFSRERPSANGASDDHQQKGTRKMKLESTAFAHQATIPKDYTGDGKDISPPLRWSDVPEGTREFALICDDPDAPSPRRPAPEPWVHWVIYGIPAEVRELPAGLPPKEKLQTPVAAVQGKNSWGTIGYRGPSPPPGSGRHR